MPFARHDAACRPITLAHPATLIAAVFTPWIAAGIALLIGFFASYLTALSWADLTFVLPATAFGNVIVALLARFWLHEPISLQRWAGIVLITLGVGFVAHGPSLTEPRDRKQHRSSGGGGATAMIGSLPCSAPGPMGRSGHDRGRRAQLHGRRSADCRGDEVDWRSG